MRYPIEPYYLHQKLLPLDSRAADIPRWSHSVTADSPRQAAVMIPLLAPADAQEKVNLLLTRRAEHLKSHPGEMSFPGGALEPGDTSLLAAAIRETTEETGIQSEFIEPMGIVGELDTISGYRLRAYVGWVRPGFSLIADQSEVAELVLADSKQAMDASNFSWQTRTTSAGTFSLPEINLNGHRVWGVTGVILWRLVQQLMKPSDQ